MPKDDQSLIPWMCFRPVSMDTVKIFSVILKHSVLL